MSSPNNSKRLHSSYNPSREADRFVEALLPDYSPAYIIITEPGESWIVEPLRNKSPSSILIALRYSNDCFFEFDELWDHVWRPTSNYSIVQFLFLIIPEEYLHLTLIAPWKPADSFWPKQAEQVWDNISVFVKQQQSLINTRGGFGKAWLRNMARIFEYTETQVEPEFTDQNIFLAAAGPTLENSFSLYRDDLYLCTVSSALSFLAAQSVVPDLCISTDGGYWAKDHFRNLNENITLAIPLEASVPRKILERNPILLLNYGSSLEKLLSDAGGFLTEPAERNGSVAGTAARYALEHTDASVYAAGLDLSPTVSFTHARPHSSCNVDFTSSKITPVSLSLFEKNLNSFSLSLYSSWFASRDEAFRNRFFRLAPVPYLIEGITTVQSIPIQTKIKKTTSQKNYKQLLPRNIRKDVLDSTMNLLLSKIYECRDPATFISLLSPSETIRDHLTAATVDLIQLADFGIYLRALKDIRSKDTKRTRQTLSLLAERTSACVKNILNGPQV